MKKLTLILVMIILSATFLRADVYIKTTTHTDAFEIAGTEQPAKDNVNEQWIGENKFASIHANQKTIIDLEKQKMYIIYPETESYVEAELPLDMAKLLPEQVAQMMNMMKMTAKVTPNGESKQIGEWACTGYDIEISGMMMEMKMTSWATTDVPFDWQRYASEFLPGMMQTSGQMFFEEDAFNELKKIEGIQVASEMTMSIMGQDVNTTTNVQEISKKPAPDGTYTVPENYTKKEKLTIEQ
ncbi:hypothetical protein JXI42_10535 [bacterium]|nr:hypothetical protein [bacterium]